MSTVKCTNIQQGSSASPNITLDASGNATAGNNLTITNNLSVTGQTIPSSSFKRNRIINGDMRVDQRNSGASVGTSSSTSVYTVDRWQAIYAATSKYTIQQNSGSVTPPSGFVNYLGITSSSAYTPGSSEYFSVRQMIEGFNTADLDWGSASARTVTLSFWVRTSLTGTFGGAIVNGASAGGENRSYPFSYTVSSANTWTFITITIPGDTTGTWATGNTGGIQVRFGLGAGSSFLGTSGSWQAGNFIQPTGTVSVVSTNGATFYITGVQLEVGSAATPYERQIYSDQLAQCWRYCYKLYPDSSSTNPFFFESKCLSATGALAGLTFPQRMRVVPSLTFEGALSNYGMYLTTTGGYLTVTVASINTVTTTTFGLVNLTFASGGTANVSGWLTGLAQNSFGIRWEAEL